MGGDNDPAPKFVTPLDDPTLDDGQFLNVHLNSEVPARYHHQIRGLNDIIKVFDGLLVFQFGDNLGMTPRLFDFGP